MPPVIRILYLIPTLDPHGAEKQLTLLASRLPRDEFDVHVVVLTRSGPYAQNLRAANVPLTLLDKRFKLDVPTWWRLRRLIKRLRPDILHTWLFAANAYGRLAVGRGARPRVIVSERCVDTWKRAWQLFLDRRLISRTACLVGNSQSVARFYRELGVPAERVRVIPNAVDMDRFLGAPVAEAERNRLLAEWQLPADAKIVGSIGRMAPQKRVEDLIWATELLHQIDDRAYLVLAGDGPDLRRLQRFAEQVRIASRVRFLGHRSDVPELLNLFDVFWMASDFEGQSNSLMEAMAACVPVIASDIPPNRELVEDDKTGLLVSVGDRAGFAKAAASLLADQQRAQCLAEAGQARMRTVFSLSQMVTAYADLYRNVHTTVDEAAIIESDGSPRRA